MFSISQGGSARKTKVLPAMIPKLVEKDLLYVLCYIRGFYQKDKGSSSHDPQASTEGSAAYFPSFKGVLPERQGFCQP